MADGALALELWSRRRPGKDLLVRAMGKRAGVRTVLDATAGLGRDASALAHAGFEVLACERAPALAALWRAAARTAGLITGLRFHDGDAIALLERIAGTADAPDAVYLDPMYVDAHRRGKQKKNLADVRAVVGDDVDVDQLFAAARRAAKLRVVVKRSKHAPPLAADVAHQWSGASTRFDLFLR